MAKPFIFKDVTCKCAHLLLQEFQNYKSLLDNHQQDNAGSQQKKLPYVQRQRRTPARWWKWSEVAQSCPTLCNPMDCSLPGSMVHGIFQARILEWAAISFSRGSSQPRDQTWVSCIADRRFTIWATREALQDGRRGKIVFRIQHHTHQRCSQGSNKNLCPPGDPTETEPDLSLSVLSVSCGGMGQLWPAIEAGALGAADLGMT